MHHWYKKYKQPTRCNNNGLLIIPFSSTCHRPATSWVHYTTSCNTQSSAPEDGQNNCPKHVELTGINKPLLLHLVGYLYFLYQWCTVKQISDNEIYLLIKYIKSVLWRVAKRLSYIEYARCLKFNRVTITPSSSLSSSSSYICNEIGPLVDPFRSHVCRSLFKGLPWFLLPVGE